ncbi:MAG: hypothetical protein AAF349_26045 [Cyanobacteria bacterium P01_A01_bin.68]
MNTQTAIYKKQKSIVSNSTLVLLAFATAYFPRIINAVGAPSAINFLHFATVPLASLIVINKTRTKDQNQIALSWAIISGLFGLFAVMTTSAFLNKAGLINLFLDYLLFAEPFILLLAIICIPMTLKSFNKVRFWLLAFGLINIVLAFAQDIFIKAGLLRVIRMTPEDNVQGVFYLSGAGNYVSVYVSFSFALYYWVTAKKIPTWVKGFGLFVAFYQLIVSDSKQVLLSLLVAWAILLLTKFQDIGKVLVYLIGLILIVFSLVWLTQNTNLPAFSSFRYWFSRTDLYGPDGEAINLKLAGIRTVISAYDSPINWLFGLGPGHTIGRLGGWVLLEYASLLKPLGATFHPVSTAVKNIVETNWLAKDSSLFSPLFTWAGIWGDTGILGLGSYLYLAFITWSFLGKDDFSRFLMLNVVVIGFILTQMEEPGYMLTVASLVGMRWQERQVKKYELSRLAQLPLEP